MNAYYFDSDIMIFDRPTGLILEYQKFSMKKRETTLEACCVNAAQRYVLLPQSRNEQLLRTSASPT